MSRTKAFRRHHRARIKQRVRKQEQNRYWVTTDPEARDALIERCVRLRTQTRTLCSCYGCNNSEDVHGVKAKHRAFIALAKIDETE